MIILSIETSADETAVSLVKADGEFPCATYEILGNALHSQAKLHAQYGGIFPAMAKREHAKTILPLMKHAMAEAGILAKNIEEIPQEIQEKLYEILYREEALAEALIDFAEFYERPEFDLIAVTSGPGLEPALWVGVNFAKALSHLLNIPVVAVNHMEGHVLASLMREVKSDPKKQSKARYGTIKSKVKSHEIAHVQFPAIALLISGGHTELILMKDWGLYEKVGQTRDDAVGEAFDKVARMMGLSYPGGPEIEKLAAFGRQQNLPMFADLPRPMLHSGNLDFSFSGLKTAVRYAIDEKVLENADKQALARDFEEAVLDVLIKKTHNAINQYNAQTLIIGGGVSANKYIKDAFNKHSLEHFPYMKVYFPNPELSTDNSIMIALAGHAQVKNSSNPAAAQFIKADGNQSLANE